MALILGIEKTELEFRRFQTFAGPLASIKHIYGPLILLIIRLVLGSAKKNMQHKAAQDLL